MACNKGGRGVMPNPKSLRNSGWRPPLIPGCYQDLVFTILSRPEYQGKPTRAVVEAALKAFATEQELSEVDWDDCDN